MFSKRNSRKPDQNFISHFQSMFADLVSKPRGMTLNQDACDPMPRTVADEVGRDANPGTKSHDHNVNLDCISWVLRDSDPSFSCLNPQSLSLVPDLNQHQTANDVGSTGVGAILHDRARDFEPHYKPQDPYQAPSNGLYSQQPVNASPKAFHRDSGYETMDRSSEELSINNFSTHADSNYSMASSTYMNDSIEILPGEKFRYNVSLLAPTAMFNPAKEDPVTYLNKGQQYSLVIKDTNLPSVGSGLVRYRTCVRVSFEDKEQRSNPTAYWQLWNDGRAKYEAPHRDGKFTAVEYVDGPQNSGVDLENASFDGFCITWAAYPNMETSDCVFGVRFNFLSTDFSHSKGVKGASVRLCVKTETLSPNEGVEHEPEVCFCKLKLFRDHGAERKLSNDVAHLNKAIEKLQKQVLQAEMDGGSTSGKRGNHPMKIAKRSRKHSRQLSWSSSRHLKGDLHTEIDSLQRMFSSARLTSNLNLRGEDHDDPDLHPIHLGLNKPRDARSRSTDDAYPAESIAAVSTAPQRNGSVASALAGMRLAQFEDLDQSICPAIAKQVSEVKNSKSTIKAVDVDVNYRPPDSQPKSAADPIKVACFYVRFIRNGKHVCDYHHAIYLTERTVPELMEKISAKQNIDPRSIARIYHMNENGLRVIVDDDIVRELPEGQDMEVEISEVLGVYGNTGGMDSDTTEPLEIKLTY
ncbi:CP2 transcription factor [Penicillium cinerascens]|uniref:CP2 transcription factor n=1 Tax=Penicillium cinerascens TaxID=70096 RepID=A0A9W9MPA9_9EURO|nr:CP2 transcription factor [Penicillium cinerascens]KAJ5204817.1 CP2 transcription factor [Penicillium cinerascens]